MSGIVYERIPDAGHAVFNRHAAARRAEFRIASTELLPQRTLAIIERRDVARQRLSWGLVSNGLGLRMVTYGTMEDIEEYEANEFSVILVSIDDGMADSIMLEIEALVRRFPDIPVIVQAELCGSPQILNVLEHGARGYLPGNAGISVCIEAISMALAGGVFLAAESLHDIQRVLGVKRPQSDRWDMFTPREQDVIKVLRQGKANKIIAYALKLAPNTVKVHVRNILKKIHATNRAEAIYKINAMFDEVI
ncbi:response regulator transcription factor [Phyllobacterium lublinensis]|jgi:DNA-binding NarL/FixJ family response regulator|uniref:response regulator transcription factor n=1 Tax=Phyllobacterium lublinensis TaxID=2875708 RepID=UPI001CD021FF|nr:response regulator transcription factor [Phyllobacterium sp. 2063]MBZ9653809.1 response regulator transcription factor [Phyllobacterium sp. 2063]